MLYFGSFNPIHKGHIALAEYAIEKDSATKSYWWFLRKTRSSPPDSRLRRLDRFSMAETACAASKYPDKIKPSVIEFMLDKPSYTIHTLRHLTENYGTQMRFSILMGDDLVPQLPEWKQYREIIDNYPIFVYPRTGQPLPDLGGRITLLKGAPLYPYSSSEIRERLGRGEDVGNMLPEGVMQYIREKRPVESGQLHRIADRTPRSDSRRRLPLRRTRPVALPPQRMGRSPQRLQPGTANRSRPPGGPAIRGNDL